MSTIYYIINHNNKELFDLGKSGNLFDAIQYNNDILLDREQFLCAIVIGYSTVSGAINTSSYCLWLCDRILEWLTTCDYGIYGDFVPTDIGMDTDDVVDILKEQGYKVTGNRYSKRALEYAKAISKPSVHEFKEMVKPSDYEVKEYNDLLNQKGDNGN